MFFYSNIAALFQSFPALILTNHLLVGRTIGLSGKVATAKMYGFVKSPISALCAISQNFMDAKYAAFFELAQALILNFLQSRRIATFYECIKIVLALLCLALLPAAPALAGKTTAGDAQSEHERETEVVYEDMVITGSRFSGLKTTFPGRIDVIDSEQISQLPHQTADELLDWVSGVDSNRTLGIFALSPQVAMRGLGGNVPGRTLVLIDGLPATIGDTGNMRWNRVNMADVDRIEVFKGPGSSIYGSNAMGGVINIITRKPEPGFGGRVSAGYGTHDTKRGSVRLGLRSEGESGWYGQVAATGLDSSGYKHLTPDSRDYDARTDRYSPMARI